MRSSSLQRAACRAFEDVVGLRGRVGVGLGVEWHRAFGDMEGAVRRDWVRAVRMGSRFDGRCDEGDGECGL